MLRDQGDDDAAALRFAEAAAIEEQLSELFVERGLTEKSWVHRFSAASCWAAAGNFYDALTHCEELLQRDDLPERLRRSVADFAETIRVRRAAWNAALEQKCADIDARR